MKRRLTNLGIFAPGVCAGRAIHGTLLSEIYIALKSLGFRETRWQLIFDGQTGGLVYPYNDGLNEIHVRFYEDRIFAELELSRSSIFHFTLPLYNANAYLVQCLEGKVSSESYRLLLRKVSYNLREDEAAQSIWDGTLDANPYSNLNHSSGLRLWLLLHRLFSWRSIVGAGGLWWIGFLAPMHGALYFSIAVALTALLCMRFVPAIGKPDA